MQRCAIWISAAVWACVTGASSLRSLARMRARSAAIVRPLGCHLLLEPGRSIVAPAGVLLMRVLYTKQNRGKIFVVVDAAMNDFIRPALYDAVHPITPIARRAADPADGTSNARNAWISSARLRDRAIVSCKIGRWAK